MVNLVVLSSVPIETVSLADKDKIYVIGRDKTCDLVLDDPLVSRVHAKVRLLGSRWQIEDCGSRNRFKVNQMKAENESLINGDLIRIGDSVILFADNRTSRRRKRKSDSIEQSTAISRINMDSCFHPRAGAIVESFADKDARRSGLLGKLATLLHVTTSTEQLFKLCIKSLRTALTLQGVRVWLRDSKGRLKIQSQFPVSQSSVPPSLHASLAVENQQGIVFGTEPAGSNEDQAGIICAILPGIEAVRGVIECTETATSKFSLQDLEYLIAVCNIAGPALNKLEQIHHLNLLNVQTENAGQWDPMQGNSTSVAQLKTRIEQVATTTSTVLISGETGTGKELIAESIHRLSKRHAGPLITVNCATFSDSLLESALFGHEKGAFTGAVAKRVGAFERADQGTIFLDEIGEMSLECQAKVLRVLEHYPFERVGGSELVDIDVRIVAATHRDLSKQVEEGKFREDLMFRLQVIELQSPPLRDRGNDVLILANHFLERYAKKLGKPVPRFSKEAKQELLAYHWPGNVRELKNMMERVMVFNSGETVDGQDFQMKKASGVEFPIRELQSMQELERRYIDFVLNSVDGNRTEACKILGISRATLYNKLPVQD